MGVKGPKNGGENLCGSWKAQVNQKSAHESKGTCEARVKGPKNASENPCRSWGSQ
jgi:hypothetical protein